MLVRCEEESCNVTQGYKMFRKLKDLRIERKEKASQLQKVSAIADRFDCDVMREIFEEVEEVLGLVPGPDSMEADQKGQIITTGVTQNMPEEMYEPVSVKAEDVEQIRKAI